MRDNENCRKNMLQQDFIEHLSELFLYKSQIVK